MIIAQITMLKLAWTVAASVGVMITFTLLFMSITDYRLLVVEKLNGWRRQVAITSIFIFVGGFIAQAVYFASGILALTQPNKRGPSHVIRETTQALFLFGALSAIVLAIIIYYRRRRILEIIEEGIRKENSSAN